jgi:Ca-activated chloride channel family protein
MNLGKPEYLHLLWLLLLIALLFVYRERRAGRIALAASRGDKKTLLAKAGHRGKAMRWLKYALQLSGIFLLAIAIAGPRWGMKEELVERRGIDIVVALDLSKSMLATDIQPSRIERAKMELSDFVDSRRGDRIGIVAFAGTAIVACPLTIDYGAARNFLRRLEVGMIPSPGTDLAAAIAVSSGLLKGYAGREKVVVLLTDGEDTLGDPAKAAGVVAEKGVSLYVLGFGSSKGAPIPIYNKSGKMVNYKKDRSGNIVISRLEGELLAQIAKAGGGASFMGGDAVFKLSEELEKKEKSLIASKMFRLMEERFQYPLFLSLLCFLSELFIFGHRKP